MGEIKTMEKIDHIAIVVTNINHAVKWYTDNHDCKVNYKIIVGLNYNLKT